MGNCGGVHINQHFRSNFLEGLNLDYRQKETKKRRNRTVFTPEQLVVLEEGFTKQQYPDANFRQTISAKTGLPEDRVQVWFQNRRAKQKRLQETKLFRNQKLHSEGVDLRQTSTAAEGDSALGREVREVLRAADVTEGQVLQNRGHDLSITRNGAGNIPVSISLKSLVFAAKTLVGRRKHVFIEQ